VNAAATATRETETPPQDRQLDEAAKEYRPEKFPDVPAYPVDRVVINRTKQRRRRLS
jgi:hypothetical protein